MMNGRRSKPAYIVIIAFLLLLFFLLAYGLYRSPVLNNPYPASEASQAIYYSSFAEQPKTLDPARSYSSNEYLFIGQIYEPLLQYDYLKRPYTLVPLTAAKMPEIVYLDKNKQPLPASRAAEAAYTVYRIEIQPGIDYQPHPAFARKKNGQYYYHHLPPDYLDDHDIDTLSDFKHVGSRELIVDDYIYQIKRLASPWSSSSIYGLMRHYILGFSEYADTLPTAKSGEYIDLRQYPLEGVKKIDDYHFEITLKGQYEQFIYWLSMPFFSPMPWEAIPFYIQPEMLDKNISLDWFPIGTGPFMMIENNPNSQISLRKNPNYRSTYFPSSGSEKDRKAGYLDQAGKLLPFIDEAIFTLEKESIPRWNKFLQGYYDNSGISADSFDQAIRIDRFGHAIVSPLLKKKHIRLTQTNDPSIYYMGFNMLDKRVGGLSSSARKLRQAISIAVNYEEFIAIFFNGRGLSAQGPIPPGIFGYKKGKAGMNPYIYDWVDGHLKRKPIAYARALMKAAGYPGGIDPKTGRHLMLNYDVPASSGPESKAQLEWMRKQFSRIGIDLNIRATQYNRFQEKMRTGQAEIFSWGWNADYPDPENFLFLLYGQNVKFPKGGENAANYKNPKFDRLFEKMRNMQNGPERQEIIDKMLSILRYDAPWIWGVSSQSFILSQPWYSKVKPNSISQNTMKYVAIDVPLRNQLRQDWNHPVLWPLLMLLGLLFSLCLLMFWAYRRRLSSAAKRGVL